MTVTPRILERLSELLGHSDYERFLKDCHRRGFLNGNSEGLNDAGIQFVIERDWDEALAVNGSTSTKTEPVKPVRETWATYIDIANSEGIDAEKLRKRLDRLRLKDNAVWREVTNSKPREPKYLFHVNAQAVIAVVADLKTSSERPAK